MIKYDERFKNYGLWVSIFSLIGVIASNFQLFDMGQYQTVVDVFLSILVGLGILSNPKDGLGYTDSKEE